MAFRWCRQSAAENEISWNTAPLMAETNAWSARFLTMPTVVEYCGVIHCASLSSLYDTLDSILFIVLCSHENSSSPSHSTLDNHIPDHNIDRKFHHGRFTLVLEMKLGSYNVSCALSSSYSICLGILELFMHAMCPNHLRHRNHRMGYGDWMPALLSTSVPGILSCQLI